MKADLGLCLTSPCFLWLLWLVVAPYLFRNKHGREPGSFQWCPVTGQEAMGTTWNRGGAVWTSGSTSALWEWLTSGTGCPERLQSLHPVGHSKATWTWSWATCSSRGIGLDDLQRSLPVSTIVWFCSRPTESSCDPPCFSNCEKGLCCFACIFW